MKKWGLGILRICLFGGCLVMASPLGFSADTKNSSDVSKNWHKVDSKQGNCTVKFPTTAEHVSEKMKIDEVGTELQYDAYVSASSPDTVFMMLVAQYPEFVDDDFAQMSLEAFLNGILSHGSEAQLLFADLVLVQGYEGLDFFIRTGPNYFKGRAVMVKSQLYLLAMECKVSEYDEKHYDAFVNSFLLGH
jgi:hypothetical protein